jgi:hypothetical protein
MDRLMNLGKSASLAILLCRALAGAEVEEPGPKEPSSADDYLSASGRLKSALRLECRGVARVEVE